MPRLLHTYIAACCKLIALMLLLGVAFTTPVAQAAEPFIIESPPLTPQEQIKKFKLPPGFEIQLVASEPEMHKPINMNFDAQGRLWFTASIEYPFAVGEGKKGRDRVRVIEGFNADGSATKVTTFADELNIPIGLLPVKDGAIVFSIPNIYHLIDSDGDDKCDQRKVLYGPFGQQDTHGLNNNFTRGADGWIYACHGFNNKSEVAGTDGHKIKMESGNTYRFKEDGSRIEYFTHGQVNPFGLAFDSKGNLFSADCHTNPAMQLLRGGYYDSFGKPDDGLGFAPTIMKHSHGSTGIAGIVVYDADQFPEEYRGNLFIGNPITHRVNRDKLVAHGASFQAIEQPDFLTCDDPWFRPVDVKLGPDGALYIADFYNCIIGHYEVPLDHPKRDRERGRIWRVVYTGKGNGANKAQPVAVDTDAPTTNELFDRLGSSNIAVRSQAIQQAVEQNGAGLDWKLATVLSDPNGNQNQRAAVLWVLSRTGKLSREQHLGAFKDSNALLRIHAARIAAEMPKWKDDAAPIADAVRSALADTDPFVRLAAADALARHPAPENLLPLLQLLSKTPAEDKQLIYVVRMALRDQLQNNAVVAAIAGTSPTVKLDRAQQQTLAYLCRGLTTPDALRFALSFMQRETQDTNERRELISHLVRYIPEAELGKVFAVALHTFQEDPSHRMSLVHLMQQSAKSRGIELPQEFHQGASKSAVEMLTSKDHEALRKGLELARVLKITATFPQLVQIAKVNPAEEFRQSAIDACLTIDSAKSIPMLAELLANSNEPLPLRQKAAKSLGMIGSDAAQQVLLKTLPLAPQRLAVEIASALAGHANGAKALLAAVKDGKGSAHLLQEPAVVDALKRHNQAKLLKMRDELTADLPPRDQQVNKLIETRLAELQKLQPDLERGAALFKKNCSNCHRLNNEGHKIGPELDGVAHRGGERLLEDILDPSRNVDAAFRSTTIVTNDGLSITGLLQREEGETLILIDSQGKEQRLSKSEVDTREQSALSPMPANVQELLPGDDLLHLLGFLMSQKGK